MKKIIIYLLVLFSISNAKAGILVDIEAGVGSWITNSSGNFSYKGDKIDLEDTLGLKKSSNLYVYAQLDHFVPILPNIRVEHQSLKTDGKKNLSTTFGNKRFVGLTNSKSDLTQNDLILYWGVPALNTLSAGIFDIDLGVGVKQIKGFIKLNQKSSNTYEKAKLDIVTPPMAYLRARVEPPFLDVVLEASSKFTKYKDSSLSDSLAKVSICLPIPMPLIDFRVDLGYKMQKLKISERLSDNFNGEINNKGFIAGISAKF